MRWTSNQVSAGSLPGATSGTEQKIEELVRFVHDAGRIPVQRDSLYNELRRWDD